MVQYHEYFHRQIQQWGAEKQKKMSSKRVLIVGAGGLGCSLGYALGCSGIGKIDIVDFDKVSVGNLHRQMAFSLEDVGQYKSKVLIKQISKKNPFVDAKAFVLNFNEFAKMANEYDLILDATDNYETRDKIDTYASKQNVPWIYASVEGFQGQLCFFYNSSFSSFNHSSHMPGGIAAAMVMQVASMQANMALMYFCDFEVPKDVLHYISYNKSGEVNIRRFKIPV